MKPCHLHSCARTMHARTQVSFGGEVAGAVAELEATYEALTEAQAQLDATLEENRWVAFPYFITTEWVQLNSGVYSSETLGFSHRGAGAGRNAGREQVSGVSLFTASTC